jgi:hypothetical protein
MTFGALALVNDTFLQLVRAETHRGLEGRAIAGFATGGKTFGFSTIHEPNPPDPEHPRKLRVISPDEAKIVLRIFERYAAGDSFKTIAEILNDERVPAPHDGGKGHKHARGWTHSTVRYMLRNEQYVGVWVWNKEKWLQVPGTRRYKRVPRPASEHVRKEIPELRIVPASLWDQVQGRLKRLGFNRARGGRTPEATQSGPSSILAGVLRCGVCGGSIAVVHRRTKAGYNYATLGCTTNKSRGAAICTHSRTISEKKVRIAVVDMLNAHLTAPDLIQRFVATFEKRLSEYQKGDSKNDETAARIREQEGRVRNLYEGLAKMGWSQALADLLRDEEAKLAALRTAAVQRAMVPANVLPHPRIIEGYLRNVLTLIEGDPIEGREILGRHIQPLVLTPRPDGGYDITGAFNVGAVVAAEGGARVTDNESRRDTLRALSGHRTGRAWREVRPKPPTRARQIRPVSLSRTNPAYSDYGGRLSMGRRGGNQGTG